MTSSKFAAELKPGATVGIIGGGQLGRMLAMAAAKLGLKTCILEPQNDCPAAQVANQHLKFAYNDPQGLAALAENSDVITYEFENVPVGAAQYLEKVATLHPSSKVLEISQDRLLEKDFLNRAGAKTAQYKDIGNLDQLLRALDDFGGRAVLKTRRLGYDGKGQYALGAAGKISPAEAWQQLAGVPAILEQHIAFEREISLIAARGTDGEFFAYDAVENVHRNGILHTSTVPAAISSSVAQKAIHISRNIMDELNYTGIMATEYFVLGDGALLVNEIAPRVHNSGHWTEVACSISQFEQHIRAVVGWPLGQPLRHSDCVMENLIGDAVDGAHNNRQFRRSALHLYGKSEVRPGRKMGHVTILKPLNG